MKDLTADAVVWLAASCVWLAIIYHRLSEGEPLDFGRNPRFDYPDQREVRSARPKFIWGDWDLEDDDQLVIHFRVEGALVWWLTVDGECDRLKHPTVMPKNFRSGQEGRIVMAFPGALEEADDRPIEFGIRYCTTDGHIETQRFAWCIWREPAPVARELVLVA